MEQTVFHWITQYGYPAIFILLVLGIVGLPVPDETLITFTGYLVYTGHLALPLAFAAAFGGSCCGITLSYILGRTFGLALIHRFGKYVWIKEEHIAKAHQFFERYGRWSLTFGYFVPGVRHFTAYAAGISDMEPHHFGGYAYTGAFLWASTFLGLGYFLGERWETVSRDIHRHAASVTVVAGGLALLYLAWWWWRKRKASPPPPAI